MTIKVLIIRATNRHDATIPIAVFGLANHELIANCAPRVVFCKTAAKPVSLCELVCVYFAGYAMIIR